MGSPGGKVERHEADHSPPTSAEVYKSTPPYIFMALCLVKHWDSLSLFQIRNTYNFSERERAGMLLEISSVNADMLNPGSQTNLLVE
jgi:hypothetical protein